jgi:D-alanyl-D-alanine dipeptidase
VKVAPAPAAAAAPKPPPARELAPDDTTDPLVEAAPLVPGLIVSLFYATPQNITGHALYPPGARCLLRRSVAERLAQAAVALRGQGLRLVAWDCTRPAAAQQALFKAFPHPGSVADPQRGSLHQRGVAIDLGLSALDGSPVPLPTPFDAFGPRAHADADLPLGPARRNRDALRTALHAAGFRVNPREWWHFSRLYGWRWPQAPPGGEL